MLDGMQQLHPPAARRPLKNRPDGLNPGNKPPGHPLLHLDFDNLGNQDRSSPATVL